MEQYKPQKPPDVKEIITSTEFYNDLELMERVIYDKMLHSYVTVLFVCSTILTFVVIF